MSEQQPPSAGGHRTSSACGIEWSRRQLTTHEDAIASRDPMLALMAQALGYLTANVPAMLSAYALIDSSARGWVAGPCVIKLDDATGLDPRRVYELYMANAELDPLNNTAASTHGVPILTEVDLSDTDRARSTEFARRYLDAIGAGPSARLLLYHADRLSATITLRRRRGDPGFTDEETGLLRGSHQFIQAVHSIAVLNARAESHLPQFAQTHRLSPREQQIVQQILAGATNSQIADRLLISPGTVTRHLNRIYAKTRVQSRTQLTALILADQPPRPGNR